MQIQQRGEKKEDIFQDKNIVQLDLFKLEYVNSTTLKKYLVLQKYLNKETKKHPFSCFC